MLTQSFLSKLYDLAKSSRFLFFMTLFSFFLIESNSCADRAMPLSSLSVNKYPKPLPIKSVKTLDAYDQCSAKPVSAKPAFVGPVVFGPWPPK